MITEELRKKLTSLKPGETTVVSVSPEELFEVAKLAHRGGQHEEARRAYEHLYKDNPANPELAHFFGLLLCQTDEAERGMEMIRASLEAPAANAGWWSNYGNILHGLNRRNDAIDAYREAIRMEPTSADAYNNLGIVQKDKHNFDIAIECFRKAIELRPNMGAAWANLGNVLVTIGKVAEGAQALMRAATFAGLKDPSERRLLASAYSTLGELVKAEQVYRDWLADDKDNPIANHHLMAVSGETPGRASDAYVRTIFDSFATTFDERLAYLKYVAPTLVVEEAGKLFAEPAGDRVIADAGCGTGLCGPGLKPYAARLVGVDIAKNMVKQATARGCYDALAVQELTAYFEETDERFDAIVSADTLCYFGDLAPPVAAFRRSLAPGGGVVFTVERHAEPGSRPYRLNAHGRYSHHADYVRETLETAGFTVDALREETLRMETGLEVKGYVVRATVPSAAV
jgi:predicted TPR repeat methyltransferase